MYKSFTISNFRCFDEISIADLKRINLIAGVNNVGKTALLEALFLHCGAYNPELTVRINAFRGIDQIKYETGGLAETPWDGLFSNFDNTKVVQLLGENDEGGRRIVRLKVVRQPQEVGLGQVLEYLQQSDTGVPTPLEGEPPDVGLVQPPLFPSSEGISVSSEGSQVLELTYEGAPGRAGRFFMIFDRRGLRVTPIPPPAPFQTVFLSARGRVPSKEDAERYGNLDSVGLQNVVLNVLRVIEPRLERLSVRVLAGLPMLHGDMDGLSRLVPLPLMGEGMNRLASLVLAIGNARNGVVLVDEIENGLHHTILPKVWKVIGEAARQFDTQVFATTHSRECVVAAHNTFSESGEYDFRLHRLERIKGVIAARTYDQEALAGAVETGLEVR